MTQTTIVRYLTPLFTALAGSLSALIAHHIPGVTIPPAGLVAVFSFGATAALAVALHWLHTSTKVVQFETHAELTAQKVLDKIHADPQANAGFDSILHALEAHEAAIETKVVDAVGKALGASPSAEEVALNVIQKILPPPVAPQPVPVPAPVPEPAPAA